MRVNIIIKVQKGKTTITNYSTTIELDKDSTYLDLKNKTKSIINLGLEIDSEEIYKGSKKVLDTDIVTDKKQLLYNLLVK
jgi:hypothetical protein